MPMVMTSDQIGAYALRQRVMTPGCRVFIGGIETPVLEARTSHGLDQIGQGEVVVPCPLAAHIAPGALMTIEMREDTTAPWYMKFEGIIRQDGQSFDDDGSWATITGAGWLHMLDIAQFEDVVYAGGARTTPSMIRSSALHLGPDVVSYYAQSTPEGFSKDFTFTPLVDSTFVIVMGECHGCNSYTVQFDGEISSFSRVEIWQKGKLKGYGNLPEQQEPTNDPPDNPAPNYATTPSEWDDFELIIGAKIVVNHPVTIRFTSGRRPGSSARDNYEVRLVEYLTSGTVTAREVIRGLFRKRGFYIRGIPVRVDPMLSVGRYEIELGGNGLVDNGQVRINAGESFFSYGVSLCNLFGYHMFDRPIGESRVSAVRGTPDPERTLAATFTEGVNCLSVNRDRDVDDVKTYWRVIGASTTNQDGDKIQYMSLPDPAEVPLSPYVPDPPAFSEGNISDDLLVSDTLCLYVRHIQEISTRDPSQNLTWESWGGLGVEPAEVAHLTCPRIGYDGRLFITHVEHTWDDDGLWGRFTGWSGSGWPLGEAEDDGTGTIEPGAPIPTKQWLSYPPRIRQPGESGQEA
jgi:hypothetical protein